MRVFAGPNGSGKSTVYKKICEDFQFQIGTYINADEIEKALFTNGYTSLSQFRIEENISPSYFHNFVLTHSLYKKSIHIGLDIKLTLTDGDKIQNHNKTAHSYEASIIADFIRVQLIKEGKNSLSKQ